MVCWFAMFCSIVTAPMLATGPAAIEAMTPLPVSALPVSALPVQREWRSGLPGRFR